jgi:hypothetical protein
LYMPRRQARPIVSRLFAHAVCTNLTQKSCISLLQTPQGWTLSFDCSTFPEDHWGLLLPQLRKLLQRWPSLSAAAAAAANAAKLQQQVVVCSRKGADSGIAQLAAHSAALLAAPAAVPAALSAEDSDDITSSEGAATDVLAQSAPAVPAAVAVDGSGSSAVPATQPLAAGAAGTGAVQYTSSTVSSAFSP